MKYLILVALSIFLIMLTKEVHIEITTNDIVKLDNLLDDSVKFRIE